MQEAKEEQLLINRFKELGATAYYKGIFTYTDFLNLYEISIFHSIKKDFGKLLYESYGGYEGAERQVFFLKANEMEFNYNDYISCILIEPLNKRFSDELTHRDFLGSILGLGLERSKIGDILVRDNEAYCFCFTNISEFIIDNLNKVRRTSVSCSLIDTKAKVFTPNFIEIRGIISSNRLDSIISVALQTSRSKVLKLISTGKIFINGKEVLSNSYYLKEDDVFSIRGHGKYIYKGEKGQTRKGKLRILLLKYN